MKNFIIISVLLFCTSAVLAEETPIIYNCKAVAEIYDEEARRHPNYEPSIQRGSCTGGRTIQGAVLGAFKNAGLTKFCEVEKNVTQYSDFDGTWNVIDRDEKYLIAVCSYECEEDTL
ncbi:MAG: hypothetical protein IT286_01330 [Proteobacteria bacterium]|jgi:hypothetical protein|nr:hypothetical protein [Pseudomonadota bacterium]